MLDSVMSKHVTDQCLSNDATLLTALDNNLSDCVVVFRRESSSIATGQGKRPVLTDRKSSNTMLSDTLKCKEGKKLIMNTPNHNTVPS